MKPIAVLFVLTVLALVGVSFHVAAQGIGQPIPVATYAPLAVAPDAYAPTWQAPAYIAPTYIAPPTFVPVGYPVFRLLAVLQVYNAPNFASAWGGHVLGVGVTVQLQDIGGGWYRLASGDWIGQFVYPDGTAQRL